MIKTIRKVGGFLLMISGLAGLLLSSAILIFSSGDYFFRGASNEDGVICSLFGAMCLGVGSTLFRGYP